MRFNDYNELLKNSVILLDREGNKVDAVPVNAIRKLFRETRYELSGEPKHGKWHIKHFPGDGTYYRCSECGCYFEVDSYYCPSCGAYMGGKVSTDRSDDAEGMDLEWQVW